MRCRGSASSLLRRARAAAIVKASAAIEDKCELYLSLSDPLITRLRAVGACRTPAVRKALRIGTVETCTDPQRLEDGFQANFNPPPKIIQDPFIDHRLINFYLPASAGVNCSCCYCIGCVWFVAMTARQIPPIALRITPPLPQVVGFAVFAL